MTILEAIQIANSAVGSGIKGLSFARIDEFNSFKDSFTFQDYPRHVLEPFTTTGRWLNGRTKDTIPLSGWILKRIPQDTVNYRSIEVEELHLEPMRALARSFIKNLLDSDEAGDIVDPEVDEVQYTIRPEYAFLSAHLFGVSYTIQLPVRQGIC